MVVETKAEKLAGGKLVFLTQAEIERIRNLGKEDGWIEGRTSGFAAGLAAAAENDRAEDSRDCQAMSAIRRHRLQISYELCYCPSCLGEDGIFYVHTTDGRKTNGCQDLAGMILLVAKELDRSDKTKGSEQ